MNAGAITFSTAVSGTAGNAISWLTCLTLTAGAGVQAANCVSVGGATPATTGAGVTFPASQSASSDVNTLDDYEEGGFTPTIVGTTTAGTATYASDRYGSYTKIGNMVTLFGRVSWTGHTGTGAMRIGGLPFSSRNIENYTAVGSAVLNNVALTAANIGAIDMFSNSSEIRVLQMPGGGGAYDTVPMDAGGSILFSITYQTS
jgi:hypothetical protein